MIFKKYDVVELKSGDKFRDGVKTRQVRKVEPSADPDKTLIYFIGYDNEIFMYAHALKLIEKTPEFKAGDIVKRKDGEAFINGQFTSQVKYVENAEGYSESKVFFTDRGTFFWADSLELFHKPSSTLEEKLAQYDKEIEAIRAEREELFQKQEDLDTRQAKLNEKYATLKKAQEIMEEEN